MKKNRSVHAIILTSIVSMFPTVAFAVGEAQATQLKGSFETIGGIVDTFTKTVVSALGTLFATAALVAFFYGIVQYIWGLRDGKPDKVKDGNRFMIYGLVALFVMFSVWGIIIYVQNIFGISSNSTITIPKIQLQGASSVTPTDNKNALPDVPATSYYCQADGKVYSDKAALDASCGKPACSGISNETARATCLAEQSKAECANKSVGSYCNLSSGQGYCQVNDAGGTMGCYAGNPCPAGQLPGPNGCSTPLVP